jgi:hypothetical protein
MSLELEEIRRCSPRLYQMLGQLRHRLLIVVERVSRAILNEGVTLEALPQKLPKVRDRGGALGRTAHWEHRSRTAISVPTTLWPTQQPAEKAVIVSS